MQSLSSCSTPSATKRSHPSPLPNLAPISLQKAVRRGGLRFVTGRGPLAGDVKSFQVVMLREWLPSELGIPSMVPEVISKQSLAGPFSLSSWRLVQYALEGGWQMKRESLVEVDATTQLRYGTRDPSLRVGIHITDHLVRTGRSVRAVGR
ncbi:hypothetical protein Landi51_12869 [Colletotrichum acutatum]